jgi:uncharacterized oligopeptide transporter (OPT) family protein
MNFSLGFFVGGQVLAGILGSAVTLGYGAEGKHGANYMQTMAASVASMSGMAVLIQAMAWMGLAEPVSWHMMVYFCCIGMFGVGVGMLYTPILVDKMQLTYPSGFAVANILRALTDRKLLKASIGKLGTGTALGFFGGIAATKLGAIANVGLSASTVGAGMVVGARIAVPGVVVALIGEELMPYLQEIGWLDKGAPFRKIGFVIALGAILGAALVDLTLIGMQFVKQVRNPSAQPAAPVEEWKRTSSLRLILWVLFWGGALITTGVFLLDLPLLYILIAIGLVFIFLMINGISTGISDSNPISSAFVIAVFTMAAVGLTDPATGLMCAAILLISCSIGVDMQQDRSTGWRLGTNRIIQFRYQVLGVFMGAVLCVLLAKVFMAAFPELLHNQYKQPLEGTKWQSAMTFKFVGALEGLTHPSKVFTKALMLGVAIGFATELLRKIIKKSAGYKAFVARGKLGFATDFAVDAIVLPSPYASSFGGFVDFLTALWFALGGILTSFGQMLQNEVKAGAKAAGADDVPEDMSTTALVGGGLIAGDSLAALAIGIYGLISTLAG